MKSVKPLACVFLAVILTGCGGLKVPKWVPFTGSKQPVEPQPVPPVAIQLPVRDGRMIAPKRLAKGGRVMLVPFRAGEHVIASQELDKIAFRMMQGIAIPLRDNRPYFEIVINSEEGADPDFLIDGYFTRKRESADILSRWFFLRKKRILSVEGKLMDARTREVLATFEDGLVTQDADQDFLQLGFDIGRNIGEFINENINTEP
ncbi:MAG: hypothetical protein KC897_04495 [Candidatus Omnitrophica bacterium]|nr:hypothetical protein [Candidatus Omnitrophota bacterium]MCB9721376.1 hypothetical protein [Candidatus Omnitrophota bacterium]